MMTFTSTVTVYPAVNATFTASDTIVCSGNSLTFTTSPGASKYFWEYGDGVKRIFTCRDNNTSLYKLYHRSSDSYGEAYNHVILQLYG